jgi:hypothetical protein
MGQGNCDAIGNSLRRCKDLLIQMITGAIGLSTFGLRMVEVGTLER